MESGMTHNREPVEILNWEGPGYQAMVTCRGWIAALMNWEERFDIQHLGPIERHLQTDEVFVLLRGESALYIVLE